MKRLIVFLGVVLIFMGAQAATINVSDFLQLSNACLHTALEGDKVLIAAGDITISNTLFIARGISFEIAGSGTNLTTLRSVSGQNQTIIVQTASANVFKIHDFNFIHAANSGGNFGVGFGNATLDMSGPVHIWNIQMTNVVGRGMGGGAGKTHNSYGLIDHCYFDSASTGWQQHIQNDGSDYGSWTNASPLGTTNCLVVEDCYFRTTPAKGFGNGHFDSYRGATIIFRHNIVDGYAPIGGHGYDSQATSIRTFEVYNNVFTNQNSTTTPSALTDWRGGTGVVISNTFWGTNMASSYVAALEYYRNYPDSFPNKGDITGYLNKGVPGRNYVINFSHFNQPHGEGVPQAPYPLYAGYDPVAAGNFTNTQFIVLGMTAYSFVTNLNVATLGMRNPGGRGGGAVLIGATAAESMTNLMNAINLGLGANVTRTNVGLGPTDIPIGFDYLAVSCDATNLYLRNALDHTNAFGYPPNQQPGVLTSFPLSGTNFIQHATVWPTIFCSNQINGALFDVHAGSGTLPGNPNTNTLVEGRDWTNALPAAQGYTFLVYPHPLQSNPNTPLISQIANQSINQDSNTGALAFTLSSGQTNVANYTVSGSSTVTTLVPNSGGTNWVFGGSGASRTVTIYPLAGQFGVTTITLTVMDERGTQNTMQFTLAVSQTGAQPPTITAISDVATTVGHPVTTVTITVGDPVTSVNSLVLTATSSDQNILPNASIIVNGTGASRMIALTPAQEGTVVITATVRNDAFLTAARTFNSVSAGNSITLSRPTATQLYRNR